MDTVLEVVGEDDRDGNDEQLDGSDAVIWVAATTSTTRPSPTVVARCAQGTYQEGMLSLRRVRTSSRFASLRSNAAATAVRS